MVPRQQPPTNEQRRLLRIIGRMPLASVANLAPILGMAEDRVRRMLATLHAGVTWPLSPLTPLLAHPGRDVPLLGRDTGLY